MKTQLRSLLAIVALAGFAVSASAQTTVDTTAASQAKAVPTETLKAPAQIEGFQLTDVTAQLDGMTVRLAYTELTDNAVIDQRLAKAGYVRATPAQMLNAFASQSVAPKSPKLQPVGLISNAKTVAEMAKPQQGQAPSQSAPSATSAGTN